MTKLKVGKALEFLSSRKGRIVLLVFVAIAGTIHLYAQFRVGWGGGPGFTSDDVALQTILSQRQHGFFRDAMVGNDNWFLKYPLYVLMNVIPFNPLVRASVTSWVLSMATTLGVTVLLWLIVDLFEIKDQKRRLLLTLLPVVAVAAFSPELLYLVSRMNSRNIELIIMFFFIYKIVEFEKRSGAFSKSAVAILITALALLLADDPMFSYKLFIPLTLLVAFRFFFAKQSKEATIKLGTILIGGYIGAFVVAKLLTHLFHFYFALRIMNLTSFTGLVGHISLLFSSNLSVFGADFLGRAVGIRAGIAFVGFVMLVIGLIASWRLIKYGWSAKKYGYSAQSIGLLPFWSIFVVLISGFDADVRYFMLIPFMLILALVYAGVHKLISTRLLLLLLCGFAIVVTYNLASATKSLIKHSDSAANVEELAVVKLARERSLNKGFANYWHANIMTYMSNYQTDVLGVTCDNANQRVTYDPILSESGVLKKSAASTFILFYPPSTATVQGDCERATIEKQFGVPDSVVDVPTTSGGKLAIYSRDLTTDLVPGMVSK